MPTHDNLPKADGNEDNKSKKLEEILDNPISDVSESDSVPQESQDAKMEKTSEESNLAEESSDKQDSQNVEVEKTASEDIDVPDDKGHNEDISKVKEAIEENNVPEESVDAQNVEVDKVTSEDDSTSPDSEIQNEEISELKEAVEENNVPEESGNTQNIEVEKTVPEVTTEPGNEVLNEMDKAVAKDSEDESKLERHHIKKKDYHAMSKDELITELRHLIKSEKIQAIKEHVEEIKTEFNEKFNEEVEQKKDEFLADGGNIIDFYYSTPLKKEFNSVYFDYKEKRNTYYQNLKKDLQANLQKRLDIIEELKGLLNVEENINTTYNHFKEIKERWHNAGPIPRDKYNTVWNTYHHHTENFYDFLHLNRDFRDLDFKHNLEQKLKIIERATELAQETDVNRAFRELQILHKMWKEDLGPVAKEYREPIWEKFSALTKQIHENRQQFFKVQDKVYEKNLEVKQEIIAKIIEVGSDHPKNHGGWQQKIKDIEALREAFFKAGKVPSSFNEETWSQFKSAVRDFNRNKNAFYKSLKKDQFENLNKKMELIKIAEDNKDSDDFSVTTPLMKKIQADWKKIGHVPRKDSDRIWKRFKDACNSYFDRIHAEKNEANKEEIAAYEKKLQHIELLKELKLSGDPKTDLDIIKENISIWKSIGRVPYKKRNIESDYNKVLDGLFEQLNLSRQETEMIKYENKLNSLANQSDDRALRNEQNYIRKKIEEVHNEIRQLENNLQFFKHADDDNPMVLEVRKNIGKHKESLDVWKNKLKKIKQL